MIPLLRLIESLVISVPSVCAWLLPIIGPGTTESPGLVSALAETLKRVVPEPPKIRGHGKGQPPPPWEDSVVKLVEAILSVLEWLGYMSPRGNVDRYDPQAWKP